jgi:hypothetical protein
MQEMLQILFIKILQRRLSCSDIHLEDLFIQYYISNLGNNKLKGTIAYFFDN